MSKNIALLVYKQTIMPVLEYCGYLLNGVVQVQHKCLQLMQNRGLRVCLSVQRLYHIRHLHKDANIDYLSVRFDMQLLLLIHKYVYGDHHDPHELGLWLQQPAACGRITRSTNTGLLKYPTSRSMAFRKSPLYRGIDLWNKLNVSCRTLTDRDLFKAKDKVTVQELFLAKLNG